MIVVPACWGVRIVCQTTRRIIVHELSIGWFWDETTPPEQQNADIHQTTALLYIFTFN